MAASGESSAKKPRLDTPSPADNNSDPQSATSIRDLIFAITGTMPAVVEPDATKSDNFAGVDGIPSALKLSPTKKRQLASPDTVQDDEAKNRVKSDHGALHFGACAPGSGAEPKDQNAAGGSVLTEVDVGITEFISRHEGFSGILKQRYSDFIVNEVDSDGNIVHLTDIKQPVVNADEQAPIDDAVSLVSDEQMCQLQQLHDSKNTTNEVLILAEDKELRGRLHHFIKCKFPNLDSNMVEKDGVKHICVKYLATRRVDRKPSCFTKSSGDYCRFVLYKENTDTLHAVNFIAKCLKIPPGNLGYAGTKDRRGKTTQEVTIHRIAPSRLHALNKILRNITLGNFRICRQPLKLGDLSGNHFVILLRNVTGSDEVIDVSMRSLRDVGFINYYGMQRFGTTRVTTHAVGRAILRGSWSEAVELIMKPREGDRQEMVKAREIWQTTHDARKAIVALRGFECTERRLLEGLKRCMKNDVVTALSFIPRNMRLMYAHAYQSYVWNRVVSRRIKELGLVPRPGDLAFRGVIADVEIEEGPEIADTQQTEASDAVEPTAAESKPTAESKPAAESKPPANDSNSPRIEPILLTEDNVGEFSITDIVLPLPGYDVRYPTNESGSWYRDLLAEDGFDPDFNFRSQIKDYSLSGGYRKIVIKPENLSWQLLHYDDYQLPLIVSDLDLINNVQLPTTPPTAGQEDGSTTATKFKALKLELSLPSSTYATMAVREVLKCGTSAAFQTTLNVT